MTESRRAAACTWRRRQVGGGERRAADDSCGGGHSVYFPHFGDQLVADLGELLDLSVLKEAQERRRQSWESRSWWERDQEKTEKKRLVPSAAEPVPESRSSSAPSSSWPSAPCRLNWPSHAPVRSPRWPCGTRNVKSIMSTQRENILFAGPHISSPPPPPPPPRTCLVSPQRGLSASGIAAPPA